LRYRGQQNSPYRVSSSETRPIVAAGAEELRLLPDVEKLKLKA
jgi:hypothetical protein